MASAFVWLIQGRIQASSWTSGPLVAAGAVIGIGIGHRTHSQPPELAVAHR